MKILNILLIVVIVLMSLAAGLAKIVLVPEEKTFLLGVGLNVAAIIAFGIIQVVAAVLLAIPKTKIVGAVMASVAFLLSAILVFMSGNTVFGAISLLPVIVSALIIYFSLRKTEVSEHQKSDT